MKIAKMEKTVNLLADEVTIKLEVVIPTIELEGINYHGLDALPDYMIPDVIVAIGRQYSSDLKKKKLLDKTTRSII